MKTLEIVQMKDGQMGAGMAELMLDWRRQDIRGVVAVTYAWIVCAALGANKQCATSEMQWRICYDREQLQGQAIWMRQMMQMMNRDDIDRWKSTKGNLDIRGRH